MVKSTLRIDEIDGIGRLSRTPGLIVTYGVAADLDTTRYALLILGMD